MFLYQQIPTPSHVQESGKQAGNAQAVHLRTIAVPSTEKSPSGAQHIAVGTSSHSAPTLQVQQVSALSSESPPAHKRKRSDTGQSEPPRKKSNDNTQDKNKDGASEVVVKLSKVSSVNTTPSSHPPKKSSEATLPIAKKIATNTSKTQNPAVIEGWNRVDSGMEVDPPSSSRKEVGLTNQTAQNRVSKPSSSSSSSSKSKSSSQSRKHSSSSSTSTSSKKTSSKDTKNSASPLPSSAATFVSKENNTPALPTSIAGSIPKVSSNTAPSTTSSSAPSVSKGLSTQGYSTPTSVVAAPVSKETGIPTPTSAAAPVQRGPSDPPVAKGPNAPATSTPVPIVTPVQRGHSTPAPPVSKGPSTPATPIPTGPQPQPPPTTTPPVTKSLDSTALVSGHSAPKSSAAHPTTTIRPVQSASSNKNSKTPPVEPPNVPNAATLPLSKTLNAKPTKTAPAPQSLPPRQSSSLSDKSVNQKAPSKSSIVVPSPSSDAVRNPLHSTASSGEFEHAYIISFYLLILCIFLVGNIATVNQHGTSNLVSNPPSSVSSLAEPSLSSQSYDLQQLPTHSTSVRCLFINGPCLFSASDDGIVHVYDLVTGLIVYRVRGHSDPVTWLYAVSFNADSSTLKALSENTLEYINQLHLITGSSDGFIRRFELRTADSEPQPNELCCGIPVTCVAGSRDQGRLYVGSRDGVIFTYNPKTNIITKAKFKVMGLF